MITTSDFLITFNLVIGLVVIVCGTAAIIDRSPRWLTSWLSPAAELLLTLILMAFVLWLSVLHFPLSLLGVATGCIVGLRRRKRRLRNGNRGRYEEISWIESSRHQ